MQLLPPDIALRSVNKPTDKQEMNTKPNKIYVVKFILSKFEAAELTHLTQVLSNFYFFISLFKP